MKEKISLITCSNFVIKDGATSREDGAASTLIFVKVLQARLTVPVNITLVSTAEDLVRNLRHQFKSFIEKNFTVILNGRRLKNQQSL